ncbi:MAG TPA: (deoxy)nucleoside triphosphate pyrophosphohydrolase [Saprospiraceae bacterium]|nr:(deoxy)nucleoside triphosphate pyrophosphohydrolase [Saprospiraceae bacterium]
MKTISVTCAIIIFKEKILAVQRSPQMSLPLKWEFPGGKLEENETEEDCIKREIREELNIEILVLKKLSSSFHKYPNINVELIPFVAQYLSGELTLKEHQSYQLLTLAELNHLDWAEADLPIVKELQQL